MKLLSYVGNAAIFEICCHVVFGMFIIGFMIYEIRKMIREGRQYFKELWSYIEMSMLCNLVLNDIISLRYQNELHYIKFVLSMMLNVIKEN